MKKHFALISIRKQLFQKNNSNPILCGMFASLGNSLYLASQFYTKINLLHIQTDLNLSSSELSLYVNIQTILLLIAGSIAPKLVQLLTPAKVFVTGQLIQCIANILTSIPQIRQDYVLLIVIRGIEGFGVGLCTCQQNPLNKLFVSKKKLNIAICSSIITAPVLASIFSFISLSIKWYWMQTIEGSLLLVLLIPQIFLWDYKQKIVQQKSKVNIVSQLLLAIGIGGTIYGLLNLTNKSQMLISEIVLPIGIVSLTIFFTYDLNFAKVIIFNKQMFNSTLLKCYSIIALTNGVFYACQYYQSTVYEQIYNLDHETISIIQGSQILAMGVASFFISIIYKYVVSRYIWLVAYIINFIAIISNGLILYLSGKKENLPASIVLYVLQTAVYGVNQNITFNYTFQITPTQFGSQLGVINQMFAYAGSALGSVIASLLHDVFNDVGIVEMLISIFMFIVIILSQILRQYEFDKGKLGAKKIYQSADIFKLPQNLQWSEIVEFS